MNKTPIYAEDLIEIVSKCSDVSSIPDPNGGKYSRNIPTFNFNEFDYQIRQYIKKQNAEAA